MTSLQVITGQYKELSALAADPDSGLSIDDITDTLAGIEGEFLEKGKAIAAVINSIGSDISAIDAEIDRLKSRKKIIENRDSSIKEYLRVNMEQLDIKKISCPFFTITLASGRDVVEIYDEDLIPDEFIAVKTSTQPDKKALLLALKDNDIGGVRLAKSKTSLRIK